MDWFKDRQEYQLINLGVALPLDSMGAKGLRRGGMKEQLQLPEVL